MKMITGANERLGQDIKFIREQRRFSLRELEKISGVSNSLISQIESGKIKSPGFFTILKLSHALSFSMDLMTEGMIEK